MGDEVASKKVVTITNRMEMVGVADCSRTTLFQYSRTFIKQTWDDHNTLEVMKKLWRLWAKALGEKIGEDDKEADRIARFRTLIILQAVITNILISINI